MAQITIPAEFQQQVSLLTIIFEKNTALGAESPLAAWLVEKNINLAADMKAGGDAAKQEKVRAKQDALSKTAFSVRNEKHTNVIDFIRPAAQALKNFYKPTYATLADWSLPITESGRIDYPASFEEQNEMAADFFTKLATYDECTSPLAVFIKTNQINVSSLSKDNTDTAAENKTADAAAKAAENATEKRDLLWATPLKDVHDIADYLKSVYPKNPRELGEWGYVVDESTGVDKERRVKFKIGETKTILNIIVGSILQNEGKGDALIYRGKKKGGEPTLLKMNDKMGVVKGFSAVTVVNPSTLETFTLVITAPEN